ncbi:hypothetical protein DFH29DRAFT_953188 [Suillus ampliporus]|nr:hypothetical protein DFH29DRAFT_953188 [Suillus ampliporus]
MIDLSGVGVQNYYQRLVDHGLIPHSPASSPSTPDNTLCPICSHRLIACSGCFIVTCNTHGQCAGADLGPVVSCHYHDHEIFCPACLADERSPPPLIQCMICQRWCCPILMLTCTGRPIPSHEHSRKVTHPPKFIACRSCESAVKFNECGGTYCWSWGGRYDCVVCPDCAGSMDGHIVCACGWLWVCGACAREKKKFQDSGRSCPGCQTFYCFELCNYINTCGECDKTTLCKNCMEEDMSGSSLPNNGALFPVETCTLCGRSICADCFDERTFCCWSCNRAMLVPGVRSARVQDELKYLE